MNPEHGRFYLAQWMGGLASIVISMSSAHAIVGFTSPAPPGFSADGEAKLLITRTGDVNPGFGCSGSLLAGGLYVLTAAHCVSGETGSETSSNISLYFNGSSTPTASTSTYYVQPSWSGDAYAGNDLALIKLNSPISSVQGYTLHLSSAQGFEALLGGYGYTGTGTSGYTPNTFGVLHHGYNEFDADPGFYVGSNISSAVYLYDFDSGTRARNVFGSLGLGSSEVMTAPGDSGGGSFVLDDSTWKLAGVHSFIACLGDGCTPNSSFGEFAGDISVSANSSWLNSYLPPVPEPETCAMLMAGLGILRAIGRRRMQHAA